MKSKKTDIRIYTKQLYKGNVVFLICELCAILISAVGALMVSWLIQQLIDLIGGYETGFSLLELTFIALAVIGGLVVAGLLEFFSKPRFISRGIALSNGF